jgi:hypothetical protein
VAAGSVEKKGGKIMRVYVATGDQCDVVLMDEYVDFSELRVIVDFGTLKVTLDLEGFVNVVKDGRVVCFVWLDENGEVKERRNTGLHGEYESLAMQAAVTARPMVRALRELRVGVERLERIAEKEAMKEESA